MWPRPSSGLGGLGGWSGAWHNRFASVINRPAVGSSSVAVRQILFQACGTKPAGAPANLSATRCP